MTDNISNDLKKQIILQNYQMPNNRGLVSDGSYLHINTNSKSCIDQIDLQLKIENNIIKDVRFDGEACAICISSTSIMTKTLKNKTIDDAINIINNFENMIDEKEYKGDLLGEAVVYNDIAKQPNRKNCALLTWKGAKDLIIGSRRR